MIRKKLSIACCMAVTAVVVSSAGSVSAAKLREGFRCDIRVSDFEVTPVIIRKQKVRHFWEGWVTAPFGVRIKVAKIAPEVSNVNGKVANNMADAEKICADFAAKAQSYTKARKVRHKAVAKKFFE